MLETPSSTAPVFSSDSSSSPMSLTKWVSASATLLISKQQCSNEDQQAQDLQPQLGDVYICLLTQL